MKQLIQNFKSGELYVDEVPMPSLSEGMVLVENHFSLISSGTERGTVKVAQASLLGKARQRPDLVNQVLKNIRREGLGATIKKVQTKLDSLKALGYSTAGVVIASMDKEGKFKPGDRVACAGQDYASHAEIVSVPQNLVAHVPDEVSFEEAAFTTLGAIALQGVRQAEPRLGERIAVIGLGLLGQLTSQLLRANGCHVVGIDLSDRLVSLAKAESVDEAWNRNDSSLEKLCDTFTRGHGFDSVIITAAGQTNDPIELAAILARKKGKVIMVGSVKMDVPRDPHFYRKELDLRMSCSYGPGRYDSTYEEDGADYPFAYVRWTEQRNMEAFLDLAGKGRLKIKPLITHTFDIDDAEAAFDLVLGKNEAPSVGILLRYPDHAGKKLTAIKISSSKPLTGKISVGFIGAGSFAQSYLIPNLKEHVALHTVVTTKGISAKNVADKFGFATASSAAADVFENPSVDTVFIATPHNTHAQLAIEALRKGKHVFVEKPLAITREDLLEVATSVRASDKILMTGFNRRFSPLSVEIKKTMIRPSIPVMMNFRVNASIIPKDHWIQKREIGGGRILGEICHFVDLMQFFAGALPNSVFASRMQSNLETELADTLSCTISFSNGSVGTLTYVTVGDASMPKEQLEIFSGGQAAVIHDFRGATLYRGNGNNEIKKSGKGHREEVKAFLEAIRKGGDAPIPFAELYATTETCFAIEDSLASGLPQAIETSF